MCRSTSDAYIIPYVSHSKTTLESISSSTYLKPISQAKPNPCLTAFISVMLFVAMPSCKGLGSGYENFS